MLSVEDAVLYAALVVFSLWLYMGSIDGDFVFDDEYVRCSLLKCFALFFFSFFSSSSFFLFFFLSPLLPK